MDPLHPENANKASSDCGAWWWIWRLNAHQTA